MSSFFASTYLNEFVTALCPSIFYSTKFNLNISKIVQKPE